MLDASKNDLPETPKQFLAPLRRMVRGVGKHRLAAALAVLVVAAAAYRGAPLILGPAVEADPVKREDFVQRIVASGHVETPYRTNVGSQVTGIVAEVPVAEGQTVKAGDVLVILDRREAQAAVAQAQNALAQAEARIRQLRDVTLPTAQAALKQAQASVTEASRGYTRAVELAKDGFASKAALDDAAKALEAARAQLKSAELQVQSSRSDGSDYDMAQYQAAQARAALDVAKAKLGYTTITAPNDGVLIARNVERGNVVQPNNVLMVLSPFGDTRLVVQIDERNLGLIALGQKALASADAYAGESFAAEVDFINSSVDVQRASVEVKLRAPAPPKYLREDMTVSVDIETTRHPAALVIPAQDLHDAAGAAWVLKAEGSRAVRQAVKVGLVNAGHAEILDGLAAGDLVLPGRVKPGQRIRAHARAPSVAAGK